MDRDDVVKDLVITGVKFTDRVLGRGAYGRVFAVDYCGVTCAAKEVHPVLLERVSREEIPFKKAFLNECVLHSKFHHPNIVKMLGVYYPSDQAVLPVLVMELMKYNLTQLLENYQNILMYVKLSILQDVSRAICYLHTLNPPLIHRNLSTDKVLLTTSLVAKVGGFSLMEEVSTGCRTPVKMEVVIGSPYFMPPEAWKEDSHYGLPLDVFSFGCVVCHVITQQWPMPLYEVCTDPTTKRLLGFSVEIRSRYIDQISEGSLKQLVITCLDDDQERRPPISLISERITNIITG